MFIRTKKIKGNKYAYLVENKWFEKGSRQHIINYLGKIVRFDKTSNAVLKEFEKDFKTTVKALIKVELKNHGFKEKDNLLINKKYTVDLNKNKIYNKKNKKSIVIKLNEGFLCEHTLKRLFNIKLEGDKREKAFKLADAFVGAGINIPKEIFISVYKKMVN